MLAMILHSEDVKRSSIGKLRTSPEVVDAHRILVGNFWPSSCLTEFLTQRSPAD